MQDSVAYTELWLITASAIAVCLLIFIWLLLRAQSALKKQLIYEQLEGQHQEKMLRIAFQSQEKERKKLAKAVMDEVGPSLNAISSLVHPFLYGARESERKELQQLLDKLTETIRTISWNLMPTTLDRFGLMATLTELCKRVTTSTGIAVKFEQKGQPLPIDLDQQLLLFRMVQESVANSVQHSQSDYILVTVDWMDKDLWITITDYGVGFDFVTKDKFYQNSQIGLRNLENRAGLLHARIEISNNSPRGTIVSIKLPLYGG